MPGRLLVVGTPIGNLADLTPRAAEALRSSDLVVAEDTRLASRLLAHIGVRRPTLSMNEHNVGERLPRLLARLAEGATLALTTDAGMPGVSDPGARLVAAARSAGAVVEAIPGPSAVTAAFSVSGMEADGLLFAGFLPSRPASVRHAALERAIAAARLAGVPLMLFESPRRIRGLLGELAGSVPEAVVVVARELTKLHEQVLVGRPAELRAALVEERGEFTIVVDPRGDAPAASDAPADAEGDRLAPAAVVAAARRVGLSDRTVVELLAAAGIRRRAAYAFVRDAADQEPAGR